MGLRGNSRFGPQGPAACLQGGAQRRCRQRRPRAPRGLAVAWKRCQWPRLSPLTALSEPGVWEAQETPARPVWAARLMLVLQYSRSDNSGWFTCVTDTEKGGPLPSRPMPAPPWAHGTGVPCMETPCLSPWPWISREACARVGPVPSRTGPALTAGGSELRLRASPTPEQARVHVRSWQTPSPGVGPRRRPRGSSGCPGNAGLGPTHVGRGRAAPDVDGRDLAG